MARRRPADPAAGWGALPVELRPENVTVETFVPAGEWPQDSLWEDGAGCGLWRTVTALRRWTAAVVEWGAGQGLSQAQLRAMGVWPTRFPPFADRSPGGHRGAA